MAILFPPGIRLFDADGVPLSGAKVRVYDANTTTPASLFSDSGLSSAISNPVETDAAGYPASGGNECGIYVAAGTYDVAFLTSADAVFASWDDMVPWGSEGGDVSYTLTGDGRLTFTGSAGTVKIQAGSPSPDDVGGDLTLEGQAGTQLDALTLDAASVNAGTSAGALKENSKKIIGIVHTEATTFTAASTVDIELPNSPTGVRAWKVTLFDLLPSAASAQVSGRFSYDSGGTYKSGAADYAFGNWYYDNAGNTGAFTSSAGATKFDMTGAVLTNTANRGGEIEIIIMTPNSGSGPTRARYTASMWDADTLPVGDHGTAWGLGDYGRATHFRAIPSSGTLTGKYRVEVLRGFGEA